MLVFITVVALVLEYSNAKLTVPFGYNNTFCTSRVNLFHIVCNSDIPNANIILSILSAEHQDRSTFVQKCNTKQINNGRVIIAENKKTLYVRENYYVSKYYIELNKGNDITFMIHNIDAEDAGAYIFSELGNKNTITVYVNFLIQNTTRYEIFPNGTTVVTIKIHYSGFLDMNKCEIEIFTYDEESLAIRKPSFENKIRKRFSKFYEWVFILEEYDVFKIVKIVTRIHDSIGRVRSDTLIF